LIIFVKLLNLSILATESGLCIPHSFLFTSAKRNTCSRRTHADSIVHSTLPMSKEYRFLSADNLLKVQSKAMGAVNTEHSMQE
jgi:hypothetical protein